MATAPRPGSAATQTKETAFRITVRGVPAIVRPSGIGPRDDALVRRASRAALGEPLSLMAALLQLQSEATVGLDNVCLLHWWARTAAGETTETFDAALDAFPSLATVDDEVEIVELTPDEEEEAADGDPLLSDATSGDSSPD